MSFIKKTALAAITVFVLMTLAAEHSTAEVLSLDSCVSIAIENSPALKAANAKIIGMDADISLAKTGLRPRFNLSETLSSTNNPTYSFMGTLNQQEFSPALMATVNNPDTTTNYNTKLSFMYPVSTGGYVPAGIRAAKKAGEATRHELERTEQFVRFSVRTSYLRAIIAKKKIEVAEKALDTAREHAKIVENMFNSGMIVESDRLSANVRVAEIEQMLLQARNDASLAKASLLMAMGVSQDKEFEIDVTVLEQVTLDGEVQKYIETAAKQRPELAAIDSAISAKKEAVTMSLSGKKPQLYMMGNYDLDNSSPFNHNGESWFVGLGASMSLHDGGEVKSRAKHESAGIDEYKWQREQLRQGIELEVRQAYMNVQTALKGMEVMNRAVEQAAASFTIIENRYKNGLAINVEVLAAETALTQAKTSYLGALFQYATGVETLLFASGSN